MKKLCQIFNIEKNDIISITGSGGKTSLMEKLGEELKTEGRVLITTSTKIKRPTNDKIDYIFDSFDSYTKVDEENILVAMGELDPKTNKLGAILEKDLEKIKDDFDYILIEADGCRNLPLKMWKSHEPVIYDLSSKAIGVFSAKILNRKIESDFIYNYEDFTKIIKDAYVNEEVFLKLIQAKPGIFGDFKKDRYIYFNQVDSLEEKDKIKEILGYLRDKTDDIVYLAGSLLKEEYYED